MERIERANAMLAFVSDVPSAGVQTEIGIAIALKKSVVIAHQVDHALSYYNQAIVLLGRANEANTAIRN